MKGQLDYINSPFCQIKGVALYIFNYSVKDFNLYASIICTFIQEGGVGCHGSNLPRKKIQVNICTRDKNVTNIKGREDREGFDSAYD